jgi:competence protein ComEC
MKSWETKNPMSRSSFATSSEIFYVRAIIPFAAGIASLRLCSCAIMSPHLIYLLAGFLISSIIALNLSYSRFELYRYKSPIACGLYLLLFVTGYAIAVSKSEILRENHFDKRRFKYLKIVVNQEPQVRNEVLIFKAMVIAGYENLSRTTTTGNVFVSIKIDPISPLKIAYGDVLVIPNIVIATKSNFNPAAFDYKNWLASQQIYHQVFLYPLQIQVTDEKKGNTLIKLALDLRASQVRYFRKILKDDNVYSVASTLILGYRADLDEEVLGYYVKTGTIHALSVSGMHVGLIYMVLNWILKSLNRRPFARLFKIMMILTLIWSYTLLTGVSPSVLRAAIMISGFIISKGVNRSASGTNILAFSAFLILLYNPYILWDVGFQLSYLAVLGLVLLQPIIERWFFFKNLLFRKIWSAVSISLAAQIFTFPLSIYYFHQFPIYFLISNLFILLPVTAIMYLGIVVLIFRLTFLAELLEWLISMTNLGLKYIAELPFSTFPAIWISEIELIILTISIGGITAALIYYKKSLVFYSLATFLVLQMLSALDKLDKVDQRKVVIFNIRSHQAVAFITSDEAIVFTKLRVDDKLFKKNIKPFLDQQRVSIIICTEDLLSIKRPYFRIKQDDILFYDYLISKTELAQFKIGMRNAIVKKID